MLRKGRFRHRLLDDEFFKQHSDSLYSCLTPFVNLWKQGFLSDPEISSIYVLIFAVFRRPQDFLGGEIKELPKLGLPSSLPMSDLQRLFESNAPTFLKSNKQITKVFSQQNLLDGFSRFSWRSIPFSANRSLIYWALGKYTLQIRQDIPTPDEVLRMQCSGTRCISLLTDPHHLRGYIEEGRDPWGFLIHDLIHADHFFFDSQKAKAQIIFCQKLQKIWQLQSLKEMRKNDPQFEKEFHYLMSDMNSVPLHLLKTFKAILLGYFKRKEGLSFSQSLSEKSEELFENFLLECLEVWDLNSNVKQAILRLNTNSYLGESDGILLTATFTNEINDDIEIEA